MGTKKVTDETFEADVLKNDKPVLDAIAEEHGDKLDIVKLNVDDNPVITQKYGILNIPTLGVFKNGEVVKELVGARSKSALLRELADFL